MRSEPKSEKGCKIISTLWLFSHKLPNHFCFYLKLERIYPSTSSSSLIVSVRKHSVHNSNIESSSYTYSEDDISIIKRTHITILYIIVSYSQ